MATNPWDTYHGQRRKIDRAGMQTTQLSSVETSAREMRLKRLILVGALASFLSIFGLTIAMDHQAAQSTSGTTNISVNTTSERENRAPVANQPQIRTRTS